MKKTIFNIKNNKVFLFSFFLPILSMLIVYYVKDVYPFGENIYLRSDSYHQYAPFLQLFKDALTNELSLLYTWRIGLGMNFFSIFAYYLSSPFNLLLIFWKGRIADFISFLIILKCGLAGFSMSYYLSKKNNNKEPIIVLFSISYALSSYFAAYNWNIMWLDCVIIFPLVILGLEKLVNNGQYCIYLISLTLSIISNFYISFMICIFCILYFLFLLLTMDTNKKSINFKYKVNIIKKFILYSLLSVGLSAFIILPTYFSLLNTSSALSIFPSVIERYFSILYMLFRSLICIPVSDLKYVHEPNIYSSVFVFLLIPLYFMCRNINFKQKLGKSLLTVFMLLSFNFNILNYIWHGFHFPNSLPCRQSFMYIFLILTMCHETFIHINKFSLKEIIKVFIIICFLIFIMQEIFLNAPFFSNLDINTSILKIVCFSMIFLLIYCILFCIYQKHVNLKSYIVFFLIVVSFVELTFNMGVTSIISTVNRTSYYQSEDAFYKLNNIALDEAKKEKIIFYRTERTSPKTKNDGALYAYNSTSTFSSLTYDPMQKLFSSLGMSSSFNAYSYLGHTPLTSSLFSVRYEYSNDYEKSSSTSTKIHSISFKNRMNADIFLDLYKNNYALPLGFVVNDSFFDKWKIDSKNPFDVQNSFVDSSVSGFPNIFHKLKTNGNNIILSLENNKDYKLNDSVDVYFYTPVITNNLIAIIRDKDGNISSNAFDSTDNSYICHIGEVKKSSDIIIQTNDGTDIEELYAYVFDKNAFTKYFNIVNSQRINITSFSSRIIKGDISVNDSGILFTSIPYDKGWKVYIDDKKVIPYDKTDDNGKYSLLAFPIEAGYHTLEFNYLPKGFILGILISSISLFIFLFNLLKTKKLHSSD